MQELLKYLLDASLITASIGGIVGLMKLWRASNQRKRLALSALFSELEHVARHYHITANTFSNSATLSHVRRHLQWAKYGDFAGAVNLTDRVILGTQQIAEVLQLSFVIRNTDIYIDDLLSDGSNPNAEQLQDLASRMERVSSYASALTNYIQENNKQIKPINWK